jgi:uncharacterized membrane protein YqjE
MLKHAIVSMVALVTLAVFLLTATKGFIFKLADAAKSKIMRITLPEMNFDHSGKNAFYSVVEYKGP